MATTQKTWLGNLIAKIAAFFAGATNVAHDFAVVADNLANAVKTAEASTLGQTLETGLEMIIPASTGLVEAYKLYWPKLITTLNLAVAETGKPDSQIILDGASALAKMKSTDPNAFAVTMLGIAAHIKQWLMDNTGNGGTIQQSMLTQVVAHNPTLANIIGVAPVEVPPLPATLPLPTVPTDNTTGNPSPADDQATS